MTAVLDTPTTARVPAPRTALAASVRYRDLTATQARAWRTAETKAHQAAEARNIDGILTAWAVAADALGVQLSHNGELVECGCDCGCDRIYDLAAGAETVDTVGGIQTPICLDCYSDHPPAD